MERLVCEQKKRKRKLSEKPIDFKTTSGWWFICYNVVSTEFKPSVGPRLLWFCYTSVVKLHLKNLGIKTLCILF